MRKTHVAFVASLFLLLTQSLCTFASQPQTGQGSLAYLRSTFPKLTRLYEKELQQCHTHYIFAVDVSGSMRKYNDIVTPALQAFAQALPSGEQVSVIPFGTSAKENTPGLCCRIEGAAQIQVLNRALSTLYINDSYTREFRRNTDIHQSLRAVNNTILNNQQVQMNVVVILTDFLNDLPGIGERKLEKAQLSQLHKDFSHVTDNTYTRVVAMQLPKAGTGAGFCLDQLKDEVFCHHSLTKRFDIIQAIQDKTAIAHWFEQLSREIMTEKLKAVIQLDNERNLQPSLETRIDIDGHTVADVRWTPNKLYQQIRLEATRTDSTSLYTFHNNEEVWQTTTDTVLTDLPLGQLKHRDWGLRPFREKLNLGLSLPTPYENELKKLSIEKPLLAVHDQPSGWVFTFLLPFWWTVALCALLLLYLFLVVRSLRRNAQERFYGTVSIEDARGREVGDPRTVKAKPSSTLLVGGSGNYGCDIAGANWTLKVVKKTYSPLCVWKKPAFEWSAADGFVCDARNKKRGLIGRYGKNRKVIRIDCGPSSDKITHNVKLVIKKQ